MAAPVVQPQPVDDGFGDFGNFEEPEDDFGDFEKSPELTQPTT